MKLTFITIFFSLICISIKASPQASEILIIGADTIAIYQFPFHGLSKKQEELLMTNIHSQKQEELLMTDIHSQEQGECFIATGLWRGFRGVWQIIDNKLYLVDIKYLKNPQKVFSETFGNEYEYENGRVFASWFSSALIIPKDKVLRWDGVFGRTYYKEEHLIFKNGHLVKKDNISNYVAVEKGISRRQNPFEDYYLNPIRDTLYKTLLDLDWERLSDKYLCDDRYVITIGAKGKITDVKLVDEEFACKKCVRKIKRKLNNLEFDIIKWNGKPYDEKIYFELFYDYITKKLKYNPYYCWDLAKTPPSLYFTQSK